MRTKMERFQRTKSRTPQRHSRSWTKTKTASFLVTNCGRNSIVGPAVLMAGVRVKVVDDARLVTGVRTKAVLLADRTAKAHAAKVGPIGAASSTPNRSSIESLIVWTKTRMARSEKTKLKDG